MKNITGYNITYGRVGECLRNIFVKRENKSEKIFQHTLKNLTPEKQYMIFVVVKLQNKTFPKRPQFGISGKGMYVIVTLSSNFNI